MSASSSTPSMPKRRRCVNLNSTATISIWPILPKSGAAEASLRRGCWISPLRRWSRILSSRNSPARCRTRARVAGLSKPQSTRRSRRRCCRRRPMSGSARAARPPSPTSCCPPCASSSAAIWRRGTAETWLIRSGGRRVQIEILPDAESVARKGANLIAAQARAASAQRGRFVMAVSGGHTPWLMLRALAEEKLPWKDVHVCQVDERIAPANDPDRNLTHLRASLLDHAPLGADQIHAMPVESADLADAARRYAGTLQSLAGSPAVLDLVHLGLGPDGHTASLVPGDPVLAVTNVDVGLTQPYQGRRRMTLTYPAIDRSRQILWLVTGADKASVLPRLCTGDRAIPAGRIRRDNSVLLADRAAAGQLPANIIQKVPT